MFAFLFGFVPAAECGMTMIQGLKVASRIKPCHKHLRLEYNSYKNMFKNLYCCFTALLAGMMWIFQPYSCLSVWFGHVLTRKRFSEKQIELFC